MATTLPGVPNLPDDPTCKFCTESALVECQRNNHSATYWCGSCGALATFERSWPHEYDAVGPVSYEEKWVRPSAPLPNPSTPPDPPSHSQSQSRSALKPGMI